MKKISFAGLKLRKLLLFSFISCIYFCQGATLQLTDGTVLENFSIVDVNHRGIIISYEYGSIAVKPEDLNDYDYNRFSGEIEKYRVAKEKHIRARRKKAEEERARIENEAMAKFAAAEKIKKDFDVEVKKIADIPGESKFFEGVELLRKVKTSGMKVDTTQLYKVIESGKKLLPKEKFLNDGRIVAYILTLRIYIYYHVVEVNDLDGFKRKKCINDIQTMNEKLWKLVNQLPFNERIICLKLFECERFELNPSCKCTAGGKAIDPPTQGPIPSNLKNWGPYKNFKTNICFDQDHSYLYDHANVKKYLEKLKSGPSDYWTMDFLAKERKKRIDALADIGFSEKDLKSVKINESSVIKECVRFFAKDLLRLRCRGCNGSGKVKYRKELEKDGAYLVSASARRCPQCGGMGTKLYDDYNNYANPPYKSPVKVFR